MAAYSIVRDESGRVCGLWLRDAEMAENRDLLSMLLIKHQDGWWVQAALSGQYRIVSCKRGCFVMFGDAPAPEYRPWWKKLWASAVEYK